MGDSADGHISHGESLFCWGSLLSESFKKFNLGRWANSRCGEVKSRDKNDLITTATNTTRKVVEVG
jgi:hypothetical protein